MNRIRLIICSISISVLQSCAGSAPDYTPRNPLRAQEAKLAQFFDKEELPERSSSIVVPLCGGAVGTPRTGWSIDQGNWCVVPCDSAGVGEARWLSDSDGNRCMAAADRSPESLVTSEFGWSDLSLVQPAVFTGLSRSFLSGTEWACKEFRYQVDSQSRVGFWDEVPEGALVYRFYHGGKLVIGAHTSSARPSGNWSVREGDRVFFNQREVFRHAIDYGGGRFDDFITTRQKQVCRFVEDIGDFS
jgi:hypothetical protein